MGPSSAGRARGAEGGTRRGALRGLRARRRERIAGRGNSGRSRKHGRGEERSAFVVIPIVLVVVVLALLVVLVLVESVDGSQNRGGKLFIQLAIEKLVGICRSDGRRISNGFS